MKRNPYIVGISGHLGSGKSTVLSYFEKNGFCAIDSDKIVHELYKCGNEGQKKIQNYFGDKYLKKNGDVNRNKLAGEVFSNTAKLRILEKIIHPLVFNEIHRKIKQCNNERIILEAIKFDSKRIQSPISCMIWVQTDIDIAFKRAQKVRKITHIQYMNLVNHQEEIKNIDYVIENNHTLKRLENNSLKVINEILNIIN